MRRLNRNWCLHLLSIAVLLAGANSYAQSEPVGAEESTRENDSRGKVIEEVVVTAQRREQLLQRTPVSISALQGGDLEQRAIATEQDLRVSVPGLTVRSTAGSNQLNYAIRGQSLDAFSDARPSVLPYFNEVQLLPDTGSSSFYDLQSIQVLKGPQGTLFGRSATGGAVLNTSKRPTNELGGQFSGTVGDYDLRKASGAVNLPINEDQILLRLAGVYEKREGYQDNLFTQSDVGEVDRYGLRASLDMTFDGFRNELTIDYSDFDGESLVNLLYSLDPTVPTPAASALLYSPALDTIFGFPGAFDALRSVNPGVSADGLAGDLALQDRRGPFDVNSNYEPVFQTENIILTNVTSFELSPSVELKNIFGYTSADFYRQTDADGSAYTINHTANSNDNEQYSNEIQILGTTEQLDYVVGGFFAYEESTTVIDALFLDLSPFLPGTRQFFKYDRENTTYAAYAQATYDLSASTGVEGLGVTAGIRYTNEEAELKIDPTHGFFSCAVEGCGTGLPASAFSNSQSTTSENLSWTLGLEYQITPETLLYVSSRRAYKGGGFNGILRPLVGTAEIGGNRYEEERTTDIEIGIKYEGMIGNVPTRWNVAGYHAEIKDGQRVAYAFLNGAPGAITVSVPESRVRGVEFEFVAHPTAYLSLGATFVYTDAEFTDSTVFVQAVPTEFGPYPDTPEKSGSFFVQADVPLTDSIDLTARGDYYAQSETVFTSTQNRNTGALAPSFEVVNFQLGLDLKDSGITVTAHLKNAFDEVYYIGGIGTAELTQNNTALPGNPRTWMLELGYKF